MPRQADWRAEAGATTSAFRHGRLALITLRTEAGGSLAVRQKVQVNRRGLPRGARLSMTLHGNLHSEYLDSASRISRG